MPCFETLGRVAMVMKIRQSGETLRMKKLIVALFFSKFRSCGRERGGIVSNPRSRADDDANLCKRKSHGKKNRP